MKYVIILVNCVLVLFGLDVVMGEEGVSLYASDWYWAFIAGVSVCGVNVLVYTVMTLDEED